MKRKLKELNMSPSPSKKSRPTVNSSIPDLVEAAEKVVLSYYFNHQLRLGIHVDIPERSHITTAEMLSEKFTKSEMNFELWHMALISALRETSLTSFPHYATIQSLFKYILNEYKETDFGLASQFLGRLLKFHPPSCPNMTDYYRHIVGDNYAVIQKDVVEEDSFFWVIIGLLDNLPKNCPSVPEKNGWWTEDTSKATFLEDTLASNTSTDEKLKALDKPKSIRYFDEMAPEEKVMRCHLCLKWLLNILEVDTICYLEKTHKSSTKSYRCLLSYLLWPDARGIGQVNGNVQKIIQLQKNISSTNDKSMESLCQRLLALTSEVFRCSDRASALIYPFFGTNSTNLAREVALIFKESIKINENGGSSQEWIINYILSLRPPWFRLLMTSLLLSSLTGFQCLPDLESVCTIMKHIELVFGAEITENRERKNTASQPVDPLIVAKLTRLKSVNAMQKTGYSRLHSACRENKPEIVRALLTFPSLDLNLTDKDGCTALHHAASNGSIECVRELLNYRPPLGDVQLAVNTRATGPSRYTPLMNAVSAAHFEVCKLLLKHSGSVLLEDTSDDDQKASDLCESRKLRSFLMYYQKNYIETPHSHRALNVLTNDYPFIVRLCCISIQAYMSTHRFWPVYHQTKEITKTQKERTSEQKSSKGIWHHRYFRDIKYNLKKVKDQVNELRRYEALSSVTEDLHYNLILNKN